MPKNGSALAGSIKLTQMADLAARRFIRSMRLSGVNAFTHVFENAPSRSRGPLKIFCLPNELSVARLGLSVSRRVGTAPRRNRIKRMLRETFRQLDPAIRGRYDFVIVVRPHEPLALDEYKTIVTALIVKLTEVCSKRGA